MAVKFIMDNLGTNSQRVCWFLSLLDYDFNIKHIPGKDNVVADGLSRQFTLLAEISSYEEWLQKICDLAEQRVSPKSLGEVERFISDSTKFTMVGDTIFRKVDDSLKLY
ncbi:hypothetical protein DSO57_1008776 [Entomophthora muscae]|uniref:Uncharacterized protein n=1 Tax=Entomophthora muscae TaxID=34485 RepID=A0ACC2UG31_9FUNG|nr:hypothetical protein DSO57_1008776 [Entomophthora muscae]